MRLAIFAALALLTGSLFGHNLVNVLVERAPWLVLVGLAAGVVYFTRHLIEMIEHDEG